MSEPIIFSPRRLSPRFEAQGNRAYWHCDGRAETSTVVNIGRRGVFLETGRARPIDSSALVTFLVHKEQIRLEGVVRHVAGGRGVGLRFTAIQVGDRRTLLQLLDRLGIARAVPTTHFSALHGPKRLARHFHFS